MNNKYQMQGQPQQILLQQLQQGQTQQAQFNESYSEQYGNGYQRSQQPQIQPPQIQQQFFPQFQQTPLQSYQGNQYQGNQSNQGQIRQPPHLQQQFYNGQQTVQSQSGQSQSGQPQPIQAVQSVQSQQLQTQQLQSPAIQKLNVENPSTMYWQHQLQLAQLLRNANIPHFYARQYATNSRKAKNPYSDAKTVNLIEATKVLVIAALEHEKSTSTSTSGMHTRDSVTTPTPSAALLHNKKTVQDDDPAQRMRKKTQGKQLWGQLDLSGQGLVNLSPKLFQYDFLESLYLNNNRLTTIPPIIRKLRGLRTLDLSHNRIAEVPAQLGLCYNLRYLYLFDNHITTLPNEFGSLVELQFLGIEGNPLDLKFANLLLEKGTRELICYLRDSVLTDIKPIPRQWILLEDDGEVIDPVANPEAYANESNSGTNFTVMSYNTLCHHYATAKMYKHTPSWALNWDYRRNLLQQEVLQYTSDIVCMQEVETRVYHDFWTPLLAERGYKGVFHQKTRAKTMSDTESQKVDGCATFYKTDKFSFVSKHNFEYGALCMGSDKYKKTKDLFNRFLNKDNIAVLVILQHIATGERISVANTHLHWDPDFNDVKTMQVGVLLDELQVVLKKFYNANTADDLKHASVIICGDFNSTLDSAVYQLFLTGAVQTHDDFEGRDYGKFTDEGFRQSFKLKLAYDHIGELPFTNFSPLFTEVIDYIWYSTGSLQVKGLLGKVDQEYASHLIGFPDVHFPSDHIPMVTKFQIKKSGGKKPDFKPDFKSGPSRKT